MARSPERKPTRCGWDYSWQGWYFVTLCVKNRARVFGKICNKKMILSDRGKIAEQCWQDIPGHFENIEIDQFVVMPDHVHGIIVIEDPDNDRAKACLCPTRQSPKNRRKMKLSTIVGSFKSSVTKQINKNSLDHFAWQVSFHDHIIRNVKELEQIRQYILSNPENGEEEGL